MPSSTVPVLRVPPDQRFETGCIATLTDGTDTYSHHFTGTDAQATRAVADYCDTHGLRVVCLSTPATIYRDMQGNREQAQPYHMARVATSDNRPDGLRLPESAMLGKIKRLDLLIR